MREIGQLDQQAFLTQSFGRGFFLIMFLSILSRKSLSLSRDSGVCLLLFGTGMSRICIDRYGNKANNVAFFDGSVRNIHLQNLWGLPWHQDWKVPAKLPELP